MITERNVLVTGGTGSFGQRFIRYVLEHYSPNKLIVFSRDELKQHEMRTAGITAPAMRYFIGDVRDSQRLHRAFDKVDVVIHAAALKQVPTIEYNPLEAVKTNILGAANVIEAAINCKVEKVIAISSDKAVNPINLYGASKLCADKLFIAANNYARTQFSVVRYGNVANSRGSIIPLFRGQRESGYLTITDPDMTRFWVTLDEAVEFIVRCLLTMQGREIFVPKLPSFKVVDLATAIAPEAEQKIIGIRPGEKLHEVLVPADEAWYTVDLDDYFIITAPDRPKKYKERLYCKPRFCYASNINDDWLDIEDLRVLLERVGK